ncbi:MAG: hypothetical protein IKS15_03970 [Opitutales bacterium]|nr:hypothetical protein [Opitutales bacterium]
MKCALGLVNALLACLALVLFVVAVSFFADFSVPVPSRIKAAMEASASGEGFQFEARQMRVRLSGGLRFDGFKMSFKGSKSPLLTADKIGVDFKIGALLFGKLDVRKIVLKNAAVYSGFGADSAEAIFERVYLRASKQGDKCRIDYAFMDFDALSASVSGSVSEKYLMESLGGGGKRSSEKNPYKDWDAFCRGAHAVKACIEKFDTPFVKINFDVSPQGVLKADLRAQSSQSTFVFGKNELKISSLKVLASVEKRPGFFGADFGVFALNCACGGASAGSAKAFGKFDFEKMSASGLVASASDLDFYGAKIGYASVEKDTLDIPEDSAFSSLNLDGAKLFFKIGGGNLHASFSGAPDNFSVKAAGNFLPEPLLKCSLIPPAEELSWFKFSDFGAGIDAAASVSLKAKEPPQIEVSAFLDIPSAIVFGVKTTSFSGDITYSHSSGEFWANNARAVSPKGWEVCAQIYQNLKNYDYKFYFTGSLCPPEINHFMEPWWAEIFGDFSFDKKFPHTDISVYGTWGKPEYMYVYGDVWLEDAFRNGVKFERASLTVWVNPSRISIFNLHVENEGRYLDGALNWAYFSGMLDSYNKNTIVVNSTLNREELIAMGGEKGKEALQYWHFDPAPKISFNLLIKNPAREPGSQDSMNLDYECPGTTRVGKFELQNLKFRSYVLGDDIYLKDMDFSIAGGRGSGSFFAGIRDGKDYFDADLKIEGANQKKFSEIILSLAPAPENSAAEAQKTGDAKKSSEPEGFENAQFGKVSGEAKIAGYMDFAETFKGSGKLRVDNPKLGTINLFGIISRLTNALHLPVGSFELSRAESPFEIENAQIIFGDIKITGPAAKIIGKARYDFLNDQVGAKLLFSPFSEVKTPVVSQIINMVNPITSLAEIDIKGGIDEPEISIGLKPMNVFKSDEKIMENFEAQMNGGGEQGQKTSEKP